MSDQRHTLSLLLRTIITHNYIIKYLISYIESAFCDRINGAYFYRDR